MKALTLFAETLHGPWRETADTQWALRVINGENVLVFPPTETAGDWAQNFRANRKRLPWRFSLWKAHAGFADKYASVRRDILAALIEAKVESLIITGYSQGGALATLAVLDIARELGISVYGVTFGAPRCVGWLAPTADIIRYETTGDPVPLLPPRWMGYKHIGERMVIGAPHDLDFMRHGDYAKELA